MIQSIAYELVRERAGGWCEVAVENVCLGKHDTTHHRQKQGQGGAHTPANLLAVCGSGTTGCHGWIEAHPAWAMEEGFWVPSTEDPAETSAHIRWEGVRSWFRLEYDGTLTWDDTDFEIVDQRMGVPPGLMQFYRKSSR